MNVINENDVTKCEVCFDRRPVYIPLITCAHSHTFCEECIRCLLAVGRHICPKCRAILPIRNYLERTNQNSVLIANASFTREYHRLPTTADMYLPPPPTTAYIDLPPPSTANCLVHGVLMCCSIGLLIGLIIYPSIKQL